MAKKELGRAEYKARRFGDWVEIAAVGTTSAANIKVDIEQLPFFIYPPMFGFYFWVPDVLLPAVTPFCRKEMFPFPASSKIITILDADGKHNVEIQEIHVPETQQALPAATDTGFCVFSWIGTDTLQVSACDAVVPAVYARVFGPASFAACEAYVRDNGGR
ncbi:hypothetical protein [Pseudomonas mosselii]|uniref:hypothetical protein n=1 Tax=Pseudomonas mosselii TaxID=78327 RepID=UPI0011B7F002|nr:hypothetical protein [Pseudomonas mosselii]